MIFESFTTVLSNGTEAEVVEGGAHIDVTWHNRAAYCAAVRKARLREGSTQTHAVLRGLNSLLPVRLLALFTLTLNPDPNPNPNPNPNRNPNPNPDPNPNPKPKPAPGQVRCSRSSRTRSSSS